MLSGHKDPSSVAAEIKMMRMVHGGAFLLVEGANDVRFWTHTCALGNARTGIWY